MFLLEAGLFCLRVRVFFFFWHLCEFLELLAWGRGRKTWPVSAFFSVLQVGQLPALCWCNALLSLSRIFELGALLFHFALSPENAAASAACRHPSPPFTVLPEAWLSLPGSVGNSFLLWGPWLTSFACCPSE